MSEAAQNPAAAKSSVEDWIAVFAGSLGALLASLDISIVNSALPQIQGEIGASGTEGTWIATGYLVSEVVMIPLSAWLSRVFGLRNLLLGCTVLFTMFSMVCGFSHNLIAMIIGRVGQGFFGGALIPTAQTIVRTRLVPRQIPIGMSIFGLIVLLGPLVGPVVGGWLTENVGWQWCFFLNLPISVGLVLLLLLGLPHEKAKLDQLINADWLGIIGMTVGLSCLTVVLEEGQRERWFESDLIVWLSVACVLGFLALAIAQLTSDNPVIKLRLLRNKSYASVIFIVIIVGVVLYGILYILPQFLSTIANYNAEQAGRILFISGVPAFLLMPVLPLLMRSNIRILVMIGLVAFAGSCFLDIGLTADSSGDDFVYSQILRGVGQIFAMLPLNQASVGAVGVQYAADAAGLYNMARNLGGSLGLAMLGVFIDRQVDTHVSSISSTITANSQLAQEHIAAQAAIFTAQTGDAALGHLQALQLLAATIRKQALVMTYSESFWLLGVALLAMIPLVFLLKPPARGAAPADAGH